MVHISTTDDTDLSQYNAELVKLVTPDKDRADPSLELLAFTNKWYVESRTGCGCGFRHLPSESVELGFDEPEDWYPEESEDVEATKQLYRILKDILERGYQLDLVDRWTDTDVAQIKTVEVSLTEVEEKQFRLFEGHKFSLNI